MLTAKAVCDTRAIVKGDLSTLLHTKCIDGISVVWNAMGWRKKRTIRADYRRLTYYVSLSTTV
jgi:hypothetical protein